MAAYVVFPLLRVSRVVVLRARGASVPGRCSSTATGRGPDFCCGLLPRRAASLSGTRNTSSSSSMCRFLQVHRGMRGKWHVHMCVCKHRVRSMVLAYNTARYSDKADSPGHEQTSSLVSEAFVDPANNSLTQRRIRGKRVHYDPMFSLCCVFIVAKSVRQGDEPHCLLKVQQ